MFRPPPVAAAEAGAFWLDDHPRPLSVMEKTAPSALLHKLLDITSPRFTLDFSRISDILSASGFFVQSADVRGAFFSSTLQL
jgi:hypothetical protein